MNALEYALMKHGGFSPSDLGIGAAAQSPQFDNTSTVVRIDDSGRLSMRQHLGRHSRLFSVRMIGARPSRQVDLVTPPETATPADPVVNSSAARSRFDAVLAPPREEEIPWQSILVESKQA
ncbi:MAG: hypothetical protein KGL39_51615 [Patescibacteria group bacterium]|nr:hypothetical protein [Patescibacteria group bacterium]